MQQVDISIKSALSAPRFASAENVAHTMTSREIAELTGKRHDNVISDIRNMLAQLGLDALSFQGIYRDSMNRQKGEYILDEEHTLCLTSGYDVNQRMAIIRQWKAKTAPALPSYAEALRGLADQIEQTEHANALLAIASPKAAFVDQYVEASGSMSFRQVCKLIGANERAFRQMLLDKNVMYCLGGVLTPYKPHQDAGRFELKTGTSEHNGHAFSQARFTAKGVQWVAGLWAARQLEVAA